ncbi:DEAD/DEAH box helicase [Streptomyces alboniger]|uniref:RNA helicase n=2 Tax=Streptomyces alboniger TaxID=132473 RepID=A0A5J6HNY5_STRAD|nr:DEAD/DEAH box helicase [Streptomyces alboniger]
MALTTTFRELGILPETAEALEAVGIITPFPIQEMTLPVALSGKDVIGQAKTGTGKTLGFGLPLLERVIVPADVEAGRAEPEQLTEAPQALIVVPTRELCQQVTNDLLTAGKARNVRVLAIYGGRAYEPQVEALKKGIDIVVGTPGRLLDLAGQRKLDLKHVKCLVLDEADEMLDLGFLPDVEKIINMLPAKRQTMLFSATMPGAVIGLARRYMSQPTHIRATAPDDEGQTVANTKQFVYRAHNMDKPEMVSRILQAEGRGLAMIFCRTKRTAADIAEQLERRGFASGAVHGDLGQGAREQALRAFRNGKVDVLVCTDVAARGIDVGGVTHVINYQSPEDEKTYLHRIGRTGRAGAKGIAITLVDWDDIPRWQLINKALDLGLSDPVETYSSSPHLYEELNIPVGTKGVLPRAERTRAGLGAEEVEDLGETGGRGRGSRDRNDRGNRGDRGSRGDRGGRTSSGPAATAPEEERPARTPRRRRRTRGGSPLDATSAPAPAATTTPAAPAAEVTAEPTESRTPRRRRRTRGGAAPEALTVAATATPTEPEAPAAAPAPAPAPEAEAPVTKPRRRTRKAAEPVVEAEAPAAEAEAPVAEKPKRTRTRKAAETMAEPVEPAEAEAPAAAEKPKRTRTRKTAEPVAVAEAPAAEAEAPAAAEKPKRTRTRKTAEPVAEAEAPAAAEKPKRTRTRKTAEAVAEAPAAAEKPKRTRTRKAAETTAEPAEPAEAEAPAAAEKPKRTRTRKTAEPVAEAEAPAAAEKPKRTRTRKTAEPVAEAEAPAAAEKPKRTRTRKTAEPVAEAEIPAQATEEPKPRRRTRKAAAAAPAEVTEAEAPAPRRRTRKKAEPAEAAGS